MSDVVILGGGSGGYACAFRAAQLGLSVTLIEKDKVGGTCLHRGCIPTKALLHAAEVADTARESAAVGVRSSFEGIDMAGVHAYKDGVVAKLYKGLQGLVSAHQVEMISGTGRYVGDRTVEVDGRRITGKSVVLATGSHSKVLPGIDLGPRVLTSDQALTLDRVPTRAIVLGGGVIGVEFASVWASFGADVTIVEALPRLIAGEDEWSSKQLTRGLRKRGITTRTSSPFSGVKETDDGVTVTLESGETLDADVLLVAVGRGPNTGDLGDVALSAGFVEVDATLATSAEGVYAVGDIVRGPQLAHRGFQHGIFVAEQIAGLNPKAVPDSGIPRVTYSNPEVASVGLTEAQAVEQFGTVDTAVYDLAGNGKSQILGASGGVKLVRAGGAVVGIHMVGARVGELIGEAQLVVNWGAYPEEVAHLIRAHPTQSEAFGEAHLALAGKPLHSH
ncbi:dihydrolipoyl dehydrogenase [Rhodococcus sp. BP-252]|uniref:dihydrolipoyl dehydrogenase n=1 Tax=unclassified Rhodococcus (in: high G+C Gram-positive bacteria) TaxID=192944 RepID=UPI00142FCD8C|nr:MULTISPECIES: dihydrolipoyl dehydrogenase [unclassified Rhodococcus (in: high G+C Gram-positive bacteria)]MBY6410715.1 dihydrolipoyl dehydrogenase [Rhodococcus sp. BP-320]MBY6415460.1 dihydrolipoyl dehydrogenase [Rhodococcus sp. BP-321]MBY6420075.1 dihydrolipoyl dehydrogenase [Rhodococcus sp. BP-324]MBY6425271.1 dihydrolipoyl dehydrogenase [Rhodococcus sp. BP-323]MBY6430666.1 dihydrolipoyl dehydrogenase [Rhodococcus sp. BP-322]